MNRLSRCKPLLGTYVEITLCANVTDHALIELSQHAFNAAQEVHDAMSFHSANSELSYINQHALHHEVEISPAMHQVLHSVALLHQASNGLFDPTIARELIQLGVLPAPLSNNHSTNQTTQSGRWCDIELTQNRIRFHHPLSIDLGGIAKGYAVDRAIESVPSDVTISVNAGGDLRINHWHEQTVSLLHNPDAAAPLFELPMLNGAVATSASYFTKKSVVINPYQSKAIEHSGSISVFANTCLIADALTKIVWLKPNCDHLLRQFNASLININTDISALL